jgi:hypothetical protein
LAAGHDQDLVVRGVEADVLAADVVDHDQVGSLGVHLAARPVLQILVSAANATTVCARLSGASEASRSRPGERRSAVSPSSRWRRRALASGMKSRRRRP